MIEPPKFYTEARRHYDVLDVEVLGKFIVELGIHCRPDVRSTFEQLMNAAGTHDFPNQYRILYDYVMAKRQEIRTILDQKARFPSHPSDLPRCVEFQLPEVRRNVCTYAVAPRSLHGDTPAAPGGAHRRHSASAAQRRLSGGGGGGPYPASWSAHVARAGFPMQRLPMAVQAMLQDPRLVHQEVMRRFSSPLAVNGNHSFGSLHQLHLRQVRQSSYSGGGGGEMQRDGELQALKQQMEKVACAGTKESAERMDGVGEAWAGKHRGPEYETGSRFESALHRNGAQSMETVAAGGGSGAGDTAHCATDLKTMEKETIESNQETKDNRLFPRQPRHWTTGPSATMAVNSPSAVKANAVMDPQSKQNGAEGESMDIFDQWMTV